MHSALFYLLGLGAFVLVAGAVIAVHAMRNAPEGFEDEEGFVGVTKGDELLLQQFAKEQQFSALHGPVDLAA